METEQFCFLENSLSLAVSVAAIRSGGSSRIAFVIAASFLGWPERENSLVLPKLPPQCKSLELVVSSESKESERSTVSLGV